jgi:CPA2 family monovalent cation:H+ antiporter-2
VEHGPWLKDAFVFFAAAGLIVPLFHRARVGAVFGFLIIGVVVGPNGLGLMADYDPWIRYLTIEDRANVDPFAELGVMFLLFFVGLELSLPRLWSLRRFVLGIGGVQFALSAVLIGAAVALMGPGSAAIVLGLCLAMSSTAIVLQLLEEQGRLASHVGRLAISVLLFQDLMVAPTLFLTGVLGRGGENLALALASAILQATVAVAAIVVAGRFLLRPLLRFTAKTGSRDLIMAITIVIVIGVAAVTGFSGLSTALGAFLAGLLLGETEYRHQIEVDLEPFKGLLLGLFFITVGMTIDVRAVWAQALWLLPAVIGLLMVKGIVLLAAARTFGVALAPAAELALLLAQAGEFAFVVIGLGRANGVLPDELSQLALAVAGLTMMATPLLASAARRVGIGLQRIDHRERMPDHDAEALMDHVIIGGFGRVGQTIARLLEEENIPYVALDTSGELVTRASKAGRMIYFGDASRPEILERAGAKRARAFVVTLDAPVAAERMIAAARRLQPETLVFARAVDPSHAARLLKLGAVDVIPEAVEASLQLGARVLESFEVPEEAVLQRLARVRDEEMRRLDDGGRTTEDR